MPCYTVRHSVSVVLSDCQHRLWPHDSLLVYLFFRKLGWDPKKGESHLDSLLRPVLLVALVKLGHDKTINEGVRRFTIFVHDSNTSLLPPDTRKVLPFFLTSYMMLLRFTDLIFIAMYYRLHTSLQCRMLLLHTDLLIMIF